MSMEHFKLNDSVSTTLRFSTDAGNSLTRSVILPVTFSKSLEKNPYRVVESCKMPKRRIRKPCTETILTETAYQSI